MSSSPIYYMYFCFFTNRKLTPVAARARIREMINQFQITKFQVFQKISSCVFKA